MSTNEILIASANIPNGDGFAIGIVSKVAHSNGATYFEVVRMNRQSRYVTLSRHSSEAAARIAANAEFKADKQALAVAA